MDHRIQICPFEEMEPEAWFHLYEAKWSASGNTCPIRKFTDILFFRLPKSLALQVDIARNFDDLKNAVLQKVGRKPPTTPPISADPVFPAGGTTARPLPH